MTSSLTGTATGLEDLVTDIVTFLTTDATLVGASQEWTLLREYRDNLASLTHNLTEQTAVRNRRLIHACRYDSRSINDDDQSSFEGFVRTDGYSAGVTFIRFELKVAAEIDKVIIGAPNNPLGTYINGVPRDFTLQYSDDDSAWTTAVTVTSGAAYTQNELREHVVGGTPGSHIYWRIIVDSITSGASIYLATILLLDSSGDPVNHFGSELIFQAPGNGGTDEIYTGIRSEYNVANDWYNLFLNGYTGYDAGERSWFEQPGALPGVGSPVIAKNPMVPCWDSSMDYWLAASGRSFRFGVKVSSNFEGGYLGFFLPYATPVQYPYPLAIGGSMIPEENTPGSQWRFSYVHSSHSVFTTPAGDVDNLELADATLYLRSPEGEWRSVAQRTGGAADGINDMTVADTNPFAFSGPATVLWPTGSFSTTLSDNNLSYRELLNGGYVLQPTIIVTRLPTPLVFGELEGIFIISGFANAPENTTVFGGTNYIILQNASRTTDRDFWALALP